jgi:hypothetical protein
MFDKIIWLINSCSRAAILSLLSVSPILKSTIWLEETGSLKNTVTWKTANLTLGEETRVFQPLIFFLLYISLFDIRMYVY